MNKGNVIGRLVRDPELKFIAGSGKAVCTFTLAVDRPNSKDKTDFPSVKVWGKTAENCAKYTSKGSLVAVEGSIQTGSYEKQDGTKIYTTEISGHRVKFLDTKKKSESENQPDSNLGFGDFQAIEDSDDVPF